MSKYGSYRVDEDILKYIYIYIFQYENCQVTTHPNIEQLKKKFELVEVVCGIYAIIRYMVFVSIF